MFREHPGYVGMFSRNEALGAIPNNTRISKVWSEPGDAHEIGELGTVLGSVICPPELGSEVKYLYFVEWDDMPKTSVAVIDKKIAKWIG